LHNDNLPESGSFFQPISEMGVWGYFSGQADGLGFGEMPDNPFESLDQVKLWAEQSAEKSAAEMMDKLFSQEDVFDTILEVLNQEDDLEEARRHWERSKRLLSNVQSRQRALEALAQCPAAKKNPGFAQEVAAALAEINGAQPSNTGIAS
jgi:hypothetical protein